MSEETPSPLLDRRRFISLTATGALAATVLPWRLGAQPAATSNPYFLHGIASGDPVANAVVIWTRVTPTPAAVPGSQVGSAVTVTWQVATDSDFTNIVATGDQTTSVNVDHTVRVDVTGLQPATTYYYRFLALGATSPVGRTLTGPAPDADLSSLRFGFVSCSNFEGGYFAAYRYLSQRDDLSFVVHLGDYIYEYASGQYGPGPKIGRVHNPTHETITLQDYRTRHGQHKGDVDLQALHARHPVITTWDDHEVADDAWKDGAKNHTPGVEGDYITRRNAAYRAYFEWNPIRPPAKLSKSQIFRKFQYGTLADLNMLDLRQYRDKQATDGSDPAIYDPNRTITGNAQMAALKRSLSSSTSQWKIVGNPVQITPISFPLLPSQLAEATLKLAHGPGPSLGLPRLGDPFDVDSWDGYQADRQELLDHIRGMSDVVFITGDIHSTWISDVPFDAGNYPLNHNSAAVEFVGPSLTSDNLNDFLHLPEGNALSETVQAAFQTVNPHLKHLQLDSHGYCILDLNRDRMQVDWFYLNNRTDPASGNYFATAWQVRHANPHVEPASGPLT